MIRKGIRPGFRVALDFAGDENGFRHVLPFRRSWIAIGIVAVVDVIFLIPAITTFKQAAAEWASFNDLFDLVAVIFQTAFLLGWLIAPLLLTTILAVLLFGREVIRVSPGKFEIFLGLPGIGLVAQYDVTKMRNMRIERPLRSSGKSWRGTHIAFDYGANAGAFGSDINEFELADIKTDIQIESGHTIRRRGATEEELAGKWAPPPVLSDGVDTELLNVAAADSIKPPTLGSATTIVLILANLVPLMGVLMEGWSLGFVMVLYWAESAVIGFFTFCKIIVIGRWWALLAVPFFAGHFTAFMAVHFLFIYGIFIQGLQDNSGGDLTDVFNMFASLWPALAVLFASHALSFFINFMGRKEYLGRSVKSQMSEPYNRIMIMHLVLILGGGVALVLGEPTPVLVIILLLKIWFDVRAHLKQRTRVVQGPVDS